MASLARAGMYWIAIGVFAALPTIGIVSGPAYAPLIFGLGVILLLHRVVVQRQRPAFDRELGFLALLFVLSCWTSILWSVNPGQSTRGALQVTLILLGAWIFVAQEEWPPAVFHRIVSVMAGAMILGSTIAFVDIISGYQLTFLHAGWYAPNQGYKYNRGINYLILIVWPVLAALVWQGRPRTALITAAFTTLPVIFSLSGSARFSALAGLAVLALTHWALRRGAIMLKYLALLVPASLPFLLWAFSGLRLKITHRIPDSGVHRLEIWDYMTLRFFDRPFLGWGFSSPKSLPVSAEELQNYVWADGIGIHPHNQWVELYVSLGALGMMFGLAFLVLILKQISRLPERIRPFAYAAFTSAWACSFVNYELSTDSWWAALAASAFLFAAIDKKAPV